MQRCGRLLSELFVQLIFVCKPGGGYNCSHVALYEDIASVVSAGASRSGSGDLSLTQRVRERKEEVGEKEERGAGKWRVCWWRERTLPATRDFLCRRREVTYTQSEHATRRNDIALVLKGLTAA